MKNIKNFEELNEFHSYEPARLQLNIDFDLNDSKNKYYETGFDTGKLGDLVIINKKSLLRIESGESGDMIISVSKKDNSDYNDFVFDLKNQEGYVGDFRKISSHEFYNRLNTLKGC
jgi:hypothetical protein